MSSDAALAFASLWLTYLIRSLGAYLLLWFLCRLIHHPQLRFRLCGIFLGGMVAAWLGLLLLTSLSVPFRSDSTSSAIVSHLSWSWPLNRALAPPLATVLHRVSGVYGIIRTLLLLQFGPVFQHLRA